MAQEKRSYPSNPSDTSRTDACLLCTALKGFQSSCVQTLNHRKAQTLCNFHTWLVAKLADAGAAAEIFLRLLEHPLERETNKGDCDLCLWMVQHERTKIEELVQKLSQPRYEEWFRLRGELCLPHARRLVDRAPKEVRASIVLAVERQTAELKGELITLSRNAKAGMPVHPGVLGRVAEYLASKRGLVLKA